MRWALPVLVLLASVSRGATATRYMDSANSLCSGGADFNEQLQLFATAPATITVAVAKNSTEDSFAFSNVLDPLNADWPDGDWTVEVRVVTASGTGVSIATAVARVDASCVVQQTSSFTAFQLASVGVKTFSLPGVTWTAGSLTDRIKVIYRFKCGSTARTLTLQEGTTDQEVVGPFGQNPTTTPTPTWTPTPTISATFTPTFTATPTFTDSPTFTWTPTATPTFSWTPTATPTDTPTATFTATESATFTPTTAESSWISEWWIEQ